MPIPSESEISLRSVQSVFEIKIRVERLEFRDHGRYGINRPTDVTGNSPPMQGDLEGLSVSETILLICAICG